MASRWLPIILALEIESAGWQAHSSIGDTQAYPRDEHCQSSVGSASDPWRTPQAPRDSAGGGLLRREYALVYRAGLSNKTGPFELTLRDKLNKLRPFALQGWKFGGSIPPMTASISNSWFRSSALEDLRPSQVVFPGP